MQGLHGQRVLITGASSGIGAGMAKVLAGYGCDLVLHYNRNETGIKNTLQSVQDISDKTGARSQIVRCDFEDLDSLDAFFKEAWQVFDGLDALVNNAGIITKSLSLKDPVGKKFSKTLAVNLQAPYQLSCAFAQACLDAGKGGAIVNNSSIHGQASCEWFAAYAASKAALDAITKVQASEWGPQGVRVNVLAPGVVPVERTFDILNKSEMEQKWTSNMPVGRYGNVEEMGEATAYLLSEHAAWMTGSTITLDGGLLARGNYPKR